MTLEFLKNIIVENKGRCAKGTAVNAPNEEAESLEKVYLDEEVFIASQIFNAC